MALVARLFKLGWSLLTWITLSLLIAALLVGWSYLRRVDEEIRALVESRLARHYPQLRVHVGGARFYRGEGIRLQQISLEQPASTTAAGGVPLVDLAEVTLKCRPSLQELLHGELHVTQVVLRGLTLHATREADGRWNVATLWPLPQFSQPPAPLPEVRLEQATLEIVDRQAATPRTLVCRDLNLRLRLKRTEPSSPQAVLAGFEGWLTTEHCRRVELRGAVRTIDGAWSIEGNVLDLQWSPALLATLAGGASPLMQPLGQLRARTQLDFRVSQAGAGKTPQYLIKGRVQDGRWQTDPSQPALSNLQAEFQIEPQGLSVPSITANLGSGRLRGSLRAASHDLQGPLQASLIAEHVTVNSQLVSWLPARLREAWQQCQAVGDVSGSVALRLAEGQWDTAAEVTCHDLTVLHRQFPYPVTGCQGTLRFREQTLNFDLAGSAGGTPISIKGSLRQPGPQATGWWEIKTSRWKQIDDALVAALPDAARRFVQRLRLRGQLGFWARFEREAPAVGPTLPHLIVAVHDGSINYDAFPYPISGIQGKIECLQGRWSFRNLQGMNDGCRIECDGTWRADETSRPLTLQFRAHQVALDSQLQRAVNPELQRLWQNLQLQGTLDELTVELQHTAGAPQPRLDIRASQITVAETPQVTAGLQLQPVWFPYRLTDVRGQLRWADRSLTVQGLTCRHGRTRMRSNVTADLAPPDRWRLQLTDLAIDELHADEDLLEVMPPRLAAALRRLQLDGTFSVGGALHLTRPQATAPLTAGWDLLLNLDEAKLTAGLPIHHAYGQVQLRGHHDGQQFWSRGSLQIDSLMCQNLQVTRIQGPLWLDSQQLAIGGRVPPDSNPAGATPLQAKVYGGQLNLDGAVSLCRRRRLTCGPSWSEPTWPRSRATRRSVKAT